MLRFLYKIFYLLAVYLNSFIGSIFKFENITIENLVEGNGYSLEKHEVTTEDGYILTMHRISHGRGDHNSKPPVLLLHGILLSSVDWLILGPEKSMGFILADAEYDVWVGNHRGNTYSKRHIHLDPVWDAKEFFNFSYHEIGIYDIPAMIDYILNETHNSKITYYGFSEGFTSFTVMASIKPEYNDKLLLVNAFGPVTDMYNITSIPINILARVPILLEVAKVIGLYTLFSHDTVSNWYRLICSVNGPFCKQVFMICGYSTEQIQNKDFLIKILANFPAGISLKELMHYVQGTRSGEFARFDYGPQKNLEIYDSDKPPKYDLTKVTAPVVLYYGESDVFINNNILLNSVAKDLPNVVDIFLIPYSKGNHLDFIYGKNISALTSEALKNTNNHNKR